MLYIRRLRSSWDPGLDDISISEQIRAAQGRVVRTSLEPIHSGHAASVVVYNDKHMRKAAFLAAHYTPNLET